MEYYVIWSANDGGMYVHGPFELRTQAEDWADKELSYLDPECWWISRKDS